MYNWFPTTFTETDMLPVLATMLCCLATSAGLADDPLLTVAETSGYQATARYEEVTDLIDRIRTRSKILRVTSMGRTAEDRDIPLLILSNPPVATAEEARASGKIVVLAFGNIHAGEVCGKEALLMLARELALAPDHPWLEHLVVVFAPIYNADGNERVSPDNRPGQNGPAAGMGQRANAAGLDLNRDYMKLDAPESRAMVRFLTEWDPHLVIDTHTTNGSRHRYLLTYDSPLNPSGHSGPIAFVRERLLPAVTSSLRARTGYETFFYGNFDRDHTVWATYSPLPRFGSSYHGLRGQMSILTEAYAYATFEERVLVTREFVRETLDFVAANRDEVRRIHDLARRETVAAGENPQPSDVVGLRHQLAAAPRPVKILGYELDPDVRGRPRPTDRPDVHRVIHLDRFAPTLAVRRPFAYVLDPELGPVVDKLLEHGVRVDRLEQPVEASVEVYDVTSIARSPRPFEGHVLLSLDVTATRASRTLDRGAFIVRTAQPLGTLVVYLLEPQSEDGIAAWGLLGEHLREGAAYPIRRVNARDDLSR